MLEAFYKKVLDEDNKKSISINEAFYARNIGLVRIAAIIVLCISIYWLVVDNISPAYSLNVYSKISVILQMAVSVYMLFVPRIVRDKTKDSTFARISFLVFYAIIILGAGVIIISRNINMVATGAVSDYTGVSVAAFYVFIMIFMPLPYLIDSLVLFVFMFIGLVCPDLLVRTSTYSLFAHIILCVCFIIVYYFFRNVIKEALSHENEIENLSLQMRDQSLIDSLTLTLNRRAMDQYIDFLIQNTDSNRIGVVFFDVDYFKKYNDYYGHVVGDEILRGVSQAASGSLGGREDAFLFRYGGEEFVVIIDSADTKTVIEVMRGIKEAVSNANFSREDISEFDRVTITAGGTIESLPNLTGDYINAADNQLYYGKNYHRNGIYFGGACVDSLYMSNRVEEDAEIDDISSDSEPDNDRMSLQMLLNAISIDVTTIVSVNCNTRSVTIYHQLGDSTGVNYKINRTDSYDNALLKYIDKNVFPDDKATLSVFMNYYRLYEKLKNEESVSTTYRVRKGGSIEYVRARCVRIGDKSNFNKFVIAFIPLSPGSIEQSVQDHYKNQLYEIKFDGAIKNDEFVAFYQPKYNTFTATLIGAEALVRWKNKDGYISPGEFIPVYEANGLIARLDEYIFKKVCKQQRKFIDAGMTVMPVSVNLSRATLSQHNIVKTYQKIIEACDIPKSLVPLELTESATISTLHIEELAKEFKEAGFILHMDDFGSGYSSLTELSALPFDTLKLDKALIDAIGTNKGDEILKHIVELAHFLNMEVVAEGVEKEEQLDFLKGISCNYIQGYIFSKPTPLEDYTKLLSEYNGGGPINETGEILAEEAGLGSFRLTNSSKMEYLHAFESIYMTSHIIDLADDTCVEFATTTNVKAHVNKVHNAALQMQAAMKNTVAPEYIDEALEFTDLKTISERLKGKRTISKDFAGLHFAWFRAQFIVVSMDNDDNIKRVIFTTQVIEADKKINENVIKVCTTDELTGVGNATAFETDTAAIEQSSETVSSKLAVMLVDINDLKQINNEYGRLAGDEAIVGAAECINNVFDSIGKVYRISGDDFCIVFEANEELLNRLSADLENMVSKWRGNSIRHISISHGLASKIEFPDCNVPQLIKIADTRLNENKAIYYAHSKKEN